MKKLLLPIISIFIFFSIVNNSLAEDTYLEEVLDLHYWIEDYSLNLSSIDYVHFYEYDSRQMYNTYKSTDEILKELIIEAYRDWDIDYYSMNWIITNYNLFIYHTNKFMNYLSIKELNPEYKDIDSAVLSNYRLSRNYYNKVKELLN